jgi:hypothetical protein
LLTLLAGDEDSLVRRRVAGNPNAPTSTVLLLTRDANEKVAKVAQRMLKDREQSSLSWFMGIG